VRIFIGETAPENLTGEIKRYLPTHLVILDAADFGGAPGEPAMISPDEIRGNPSISSHNLPLNVLTDYLVAHLKCEVVILGVQPASSRFGEPIGEVVQAGAKALARMVLDCLFV
jgi:hydrogenase 3 maturation protease